MNAGRSIETGGVIIASACGGQSQRGNDRALKAKNRLPTKTPLHVFLIESKVDTEKPLTVLALEL